MVFSLNTGGLLLPDIDIERLRSNTLGSWLLVRGWSINRLIFALRNVHQLVE